MHVADFWEALAFMIVKGLEDRMLLLVNADDQLEDNGKSIPSNFKIQSSRVVLNIAISSHIECRWGQLYSCMY